MSIRLLASDLDGTLLNSASEISKENRDAIGRLCELGVLFVPSTGRAYSELATELKDNPDIRYYICSGGAVMYDKQTGEKIDELISREHISKITEILSRYDSWCIIHYDNYTYVQESEITEERMDHYELHPYLRNLATRTAKRTGDLAEMLKSCDGVEMIAACFLSEEEAIGCEGELREIDGINVLRGTMGHGIHNVELVASGACKGDMLLRLADHLGLSYDCVAAVGDSSNDLSMIRAVRSSFAVSNASPEVKAVAGEVICSNDEHAVSYILENYIKKPENHNKTKKNTITGDVK